MRLILLCGPAFSGKTTLSRAIEKRGALRVSTDDLVIAAGHDPAEGVPIEAWEAASRAACRVIDIAARDRRDVVLDDTCCFRFLRDRYRETGRAAALDVHLVVLEIEPDEIRRRAAENERARKRDGLPRDVLDDHLASFEWPGEDEEAIVLDATRSTEEHIARLESSGWLGASRRNIS